METTNIVDFARRGMTDALTDLLRTGARDLIASAVEAELADYMAQFSAVRTDTGHAAVVRNGHHPARPFQTGIGPVSVRIPKVRSKDGTPVTFRSSLVPPYVRRTKTLEAALPWLYLKGVSSGEMGAALKVLLGPDAVGLSANVVSRLKRGWAAEYDGWREAALDDEPIVYIWADGVHSGLRGTDDKLCALVIVGVTARGKKRFLAIEDGVRESTQSWREVLLNLKDRGMNAPKLAIGDGAMGFWAAMDEIYPALFIRTYEAKYPKATLCLQKDREELMAFFDFPAQHWQSIRTSNPIESAFATIRHRTKRSKGCLTRDAMLHMMFKLGQCAEDNWRRLRGFDYLAKVITGATFKDGIEAAKTGQIAA